MIETIKVALLELAADDNQNMPIYMGTDIEGKFENEHAENVYKKLTNRYSDKVEMYLLPKNKSGLIWCLNNDIDIVSMSALDWDAVGYSDIKQKYIDLYEKPLLEKAFCICGAGNNGADGESPASERGWFSVGAVDTLGNPRNYSSWGNFLVRCVAIDGIDGDYGTSFTSPVIADGAIDFALNHLEATGFKPNNPRHYEEFILDNCHDVWDNGHDLRTGEGLFKKPNRFIFKVTKYVQNEKQYITDRIVHYRNKNTLTNPIIRMADVNPHIDAESGRMVMASTDISVPFGLSKHWDQEGKVATYSGL